jgi:nitrate reductase molybdenum cofactor assembly chaperone NarJ/NarW
MAVYGLFADILNYPGPETASQVRSCIDELAAENPEARELITRFEAEQARMNLGQLQEIYTGTFDMRAECTPNLGYHLFGDDTRRNIFMAQLKQRMDAHRVGTGSELPDHLSLVLRLLEEQDATDERLALIEDCLLPAISRMVEALDQRSSPDLYSSVLRALLILLRKQSGVEALPAEALPGPTMTRA